jgi:protein import protein ZIM17
MRLSVGADTSESRPSCRDQSLNVSESVQSSTLPTFHSCPRDPALFFIRLINQLTRTHTMNPSQALRSLSRASQQSLRAPFGLQQQRTWAAPSALLRKPQNNTPAPLNNIRIRLHSTESSSSNGTRAPRPLTDRDSIDSTRVKSDKEAIAERKAQQPCYDMTFTCKKCLERSSHRITKQAYHFGTVLVNCPGCKGRHLIADHMKVSLGRVSNVDGLRFFLGSGRWRRNDSDNC